MFTFLLGKMLNNKWMVLCLLIGNILLVGIVSGAPLYSNATLQRMLMKGVEQQQITTGRYPGYMEFSYQFNNVEPDQIIKGYTAARDITNNEIRRSLGLPLLFDIEMLSMQNQYFSPEIKREEIGRSRGVSIVAYTDFEDHIKITGGRMYATEPVDGIIECLVNQRTLENQDILLNDVMIFKDTKVNGEPIKLKAVGIYENKDENDYYWNTSPNDMFGRLIIPHGLMQSLFVDNYDMAYRINAYFMSILDLNAMRAGDVKNYLAVNDQYAERYQKSRVYALRADFLPVIKGFSQSEMRLNITLWVLQVPLFVMLAFFIFMVSKQILMIEQNDISVIKSRGAGRGQIVGVYLAQGIIISVISYAAGLPLGVFICKVLGSSSGFLNLVSRTALDVQLNTQALILPLIACAISVMTMLVPVISYSRVSIVDHKRGRVKKKKPFWQRFFLDVFATAIALYALYGYQSIRAVIGAAAADAQTSDPLLFLSSSLFIIGVGLLSLRIFPLLVKLVFWLGRSVWSPPLYASFLKVIRSAGEEQFIMIFLIFTLAIGVFDAKAARTINFNQEDAIRYTNGADLIIKEVWQNNLPPAGANVQGPGNAETTTPKVIIYKEPDFEKYRNYEDAVAVTKVQRNQVTADVMSGRLDKVELMGIDTKGFGETVWYRNDLFKTHFNNYLNVLSREPSAAILSRNFADKYGFKIGDVLSFKGPQDYASCVVYGFTDYWPGFSRYTVTKDKDGQMVTNEAFLIVANINYIQSAWGVTPYEVWMKTSAASNNGFYQFITENNLQLTAFTDTKADLVDARNEPILQGTNGILTVSFIIILLICFTGFLIYWILSIRSRVLQFGIFRAMGMSMRSILELLMNEQFFISILSIAIGVGVGEVASKLYVPLVQMSYSIAEMSIPFKIVTLIQDYARLFTVVGGMVIICVVVLSVLISKIKIASALKLGED